MSVCSPYRTASRARLLGSAELAAVGAHSRLRPGASSICVTMSSLLAELRALPAHASASSYCPSVQSTWPSWPAWVESQPRSPMPLEQVARLPQRCLGQLRLARARLDVEGHSPRCDDCDVRAQLSSRAPGAR